MVTNGLDRHGGLKGARLQLKNAISALKPSRLLLQAPTDFGGGSIILDVPVLIPLILSRHPLVVAIRTFCQ